MQGEQGERVKVGGMGRVWMAKVHSHSHWVLSMQWAQEARQAATGVTGRQAASQGPQRRAHQRIISARELSSSAALGLALLHRRHLAHQRLDHGRAVAEANNK
jgi:hypothetical protein